MGNGPTGWRIFQLGSLRRFVGERLVGERLVGERIRRAVSTLRRFRISGFQVTDQVVQTLIGGSMMDPRAGDESPIVEEGRYFGFLHVDRTLDGTLKLLATPLRLRLHDRTHLCSYLSYYRHLLGELLCPSVSSGSAVGHGRRFDDLGIQ